MSTSEIDRLKELLDLKDLKLVELQDELDSAHDKVLSLEGDIDKIELGWTLPSINYEDLLDLPIPRFEVRWYQYYKNQREADWSSYRVVYQLVYKHMLNHTVSIPLGVTEIRGHGDMPPPWHRGEATNDLCELPIRDGAHVIHDSSHFKLPAYAVTPDGDTFRIDMGTDKNQYFMSLGRKHRRELDITGALQQE